jgi:serine/threonine-protein kinase RsbT
MRFARELGFGELAAREVALSVSELVSNVLKYARSGQMTLQRVSGARAGMQVIVEDDGPGIADPQAAVADGYTQGRLHTGADAAWPRSSLGLGLGAVKRLTDSMLIENRPEGGTKIVICKWLPPTSSGAAQR